MIVKTNLYQYPHDIKTLQWCDHELSVWIKKKGEDTILYNFFSSADLIY